MIATLATVLACGEESGPMEGASATGGPATTGTSSGGVATDGSAGETDTTENATDTTENATDTTESTTTAMTTAEGTSTTDAGETTGGELPTCHNTVVLMGYWPPTNEMIRRFSDDPEKNPEGWIGADWRGYGYDVYAFFPEFPPDGDPTNDELGDPGAVGSPESDLQVDYQDTSADFWAIVDEYQPALLITTSRGGEIGWEIEAVEGGHSGGGTDPALDWYPDFYGDVIQPSERSVEARSWTGISTYRQGTQLPSQLPMDAIFAASDALALTNVEIEQTTSGNFLSGFLGLHGLLYNLEAEQNLAAGHIHVGFGLPVDAAIELIETTLEVVIEAHPLTCAPEDL